MPSKPKPVKLEQTGSITWNQFKKRLIWACNSANFHGLKLVGTKDVSLIIRLLFAFITCFSLSLCSYLIMLQYQDYNQQLIVSRIISTSYPVWKFRFPSATVCNFNVVRKNNMKNLMNLVTSHGIKQEIFMDFVYNLSSLVMYDDKNEVVNISHYKEIYDVLEQNSYNVDRTMEELAQPCDRMVKKCYWRASEVPCSQIIQQIKTSNGYCCSFNYYGKNKATDGIIDAKNLNDTYMGFIGSNYGLRLLLDVEEDQYISPTKSAHGFNVLVQDGGDYADMLLTTNTLSKRQEMSISVKPTIYVSSKDVKDMDIKKRHCLFEDEGNMKWHSGYSYKTCLSECTANAILELCGCIPFFYFIHTDKRICSYFDESCLERNKNRYTTLHIAEDFVIENEEEQKGNEEQKEEEKADKDYISCRCYPQCNERIFNLVVNTAQGSTSENLQDGKNLSILNVYYNGANCIKTKKDVYYTWYRILSAVGGIFSLCLGGSIISIVECCYVVGKCMYKYNDTVSKVENPLVVVTRINIKASRQHTKNFKKKEVPGSKAKMFVKAFGNK